MSEFAEDLTGKINLVRTIDQITGKAHSLSVEQAAELYQILMREYTNGLISDKQRIKFYRELEDFARYRREAIERQDRPVVKIEAEN